MVFASNALDATRRDIGRMRFHYHRREMDAEFRRFRDSDAELNRFRGECRWTIRSLGDVEGIIGWHEAKSKEIEGIGLMVCNQIKGIGSAS